MLLVCLSLTPPSPHHHYYYYYHYGSVQCPPTVVGRNLEDSIQQQQHHRDRLPIVLLVRARTSTVQDRGRICERTFPLGVGQRFDEYEHHQKEPIIRFLVCCCCVVGFVLFCFCDFFGRWRASIWIVIFYFLSEEISPRNVVSICKIR